MPELTLISLAAVLLYGVVAGVCGFACLTARRAGQSPSSGANWLALAVFFVFLMAWRGLLIEDWIEFTMREALRAEGIYRDRRDMQSLIFIALAAIFGVAAVVWTYWSFRRIRDRRDWLLFAANSASLVMIALIAVRMLSFHAVDMLLYGLRINWMVDIGSTLVVGASAVMTVRLADKRLARRTRREKPGTAVPHIMAARRIEDEPSQ